MLCLTGVLRCYGYDIALDKQQNGMPASKLCSVHFKLSRKVSIKSGNCFDPVLCALQGYSFVPAYDDEALKEALYSRGPLATSIDASQPSFRFYSHGELVA